MKSALYLICGMLALAVAALWLWKIIGASAEPLPPLVQDMAQRVPRRGLPLPPERVPFRPHETAPSMSAEQLYAVHCAACHGADGSGKGFVAQQPGMPTVGDLTRPSASPEEQARILSEGRGAMPSFGRRLTAEARRALLSYISTLNNHR